MKYPASSDALKLIGKTTWHVKQRMNQVHLLGHFRRSIGPSHPQLLRQIFFEFFDAALLCQKGGVHVFDCMHPAVPETHVRVVAQQRGFQRLSENATAVKLGPRMLEKFVAKQILHQLKQLVQTLRVGQRRVKGNGRGSLGLLAQLVKYRAQLVVGHAIAEREFAAHHGQQIHEKPVVGHAAIHPFKVRLEHQLVKAEIVVRDPHHILAAVLFTQHAFDFLHQVWQRERVVVSQSLFINPVKLGRGNDAVIRPHVFVQQYRSSFPVQNRYLHNRHI